MNAVHDSTEAKKVIDREIESLIEHETRLDESVMRLTTDLATTQERLLSARRKLSALRVTRFMLDSVGAQVIGEPTALFSELGNPCNEY